jgi:hypothetical protein
VEFAKIVTKIIKVKINFFIAYLLKFKEKPGGGSLPEKPLSG